VRDEISIVIQINGKVRGKIEIAPDTPEEKIKELALQVENVKRTLEGKTIRKIILIPGKMMSIAVSD
jgi:leucyl-tRNA synthetase